MLAGILGIAGHAQAPSPSPVIVQRQINEVAASCWLARRRLLDGEPGRRPGESVKVYLARLVQPQAGENAPALRTRLAGYVGAFQHVSEAARQMPHPILLVGDGENRALWQTATTSAGLLPGRVVKLQMVWKRVQRGETRSAALAPELDAALALTLRLYAALRDARP